MLLGKNDPPNLRSSNSVKVIYSFKHNTVPVLIYGNETWSIKASDARRITAAEMKYMRRTAGYSWADHKTNEQTAKELKNDTSFGQITGI